MQSHQLIVIEALIRAYPNYLHVKELPTETVHDAVSLILVILE